ncbi:MAG: MFS transporter [Planctomycetes bacterium]|nr:MFS transporter [Planctomycetota bacterium]
MASDEGQPGDPSPETIEPPPPAEQTQGMWSSLPRMFSSLRYRNYRLFFAGHSLSMTGAWAQRVALSWLVWELTGSKVWLGYISAVGPLPMTFLSFLGGIVAERFDRRRILYITQSLMALPPLAIAAALIVDRDLKYINEWHLLLVAGLHGLLMAFDVPARQAFVVKMVGRKDIANAIALNSSLFNVSRMVGSGLGAALMAIIGAAACFAANGLTYVALIVALLLMRFPPTSEAEQRAAGVARHPFGGFYYVWSHKAVRATMVLLAATSILGWSFLTLLPAFADKVFGRGGGTFGAFMSVFGGGALVGALIMAYLGYYKKRQRLILIGSGLFIGSVAAFTLTRVWWAALLPLFFSGMGLLISMAGINSLVQLVVNERFRGRVMGVYATLFGGMMPAGSLAAGFMAEHLTSPVAVQINLVMLTFVTVGVALYWRHLPTVAAAEG